MSPTTQTEKGQKTRVRIVEESVQLFSVSGFNNTSMDQILEATGLTKGGFYAHFKSKEELGFAVLDRAVEMWKEKVLPKLGALTDPLKRLEALFDCGVEMAECRTFKGGCIFMNLAIEMDDLHEGFAKRLREIFRDWKKNIVAILDEGKKRGDLRSDFDSASMANTIIGTMEGATMLAKLQKDIGIQKATCKNLNVLLQGLRR